MKVVWILRVGVSTRVGRAMCLGARLEWPAVAVNAARGAPGKMRCIAGCRGALAFPVVVGVLARPAVLRLLVQWRDPARPAVAGAVAHPAMLHGHASCCRSHFRHKTERKAGSTLRSSRAPPQY